MDLPGSVEEVVGSATASFAERAQHEARWLVLWMLSVSAAVPSSTLEQIDHAFGERLSDRSIDAFEDDMPHALTGAAAVLSQLLAAGHNLDAWRYYLAIMRCAHEVVALDVIPTSAALARLDVLRHLLLRTIDAAGARPAGLGRAAAAGEGGPREAPPAPEEPAPERVGAEPSDRSAPQGDELEAILAELDALIGLEPVKAEVRRVADRLFVDRLREDAGLAVPTTSRHLVFTGNPGTGKTTVARLLARIYAALGVVARGHLVEVGRDGLVAGFIGQTAARVVEVFDEADEGVLLIDEAYSLARGGERDFGREAIDAVVKLSEDRRERVVVVLAGYPEEMGALLTMNPGMASRFPRTIAFPDYELDELVEIARAVAAAGSYELTDDAVSTLTEVFAATGRGRGFGNGRLARTVVELAADRHAARIAAGVRAGHDAARDVLMRLTAADIPTDLGASDPPPSPIDEVRAASHLDT